MERDTLKRKLAAIGTAALIAAAGGEIHAQTQTPIATHPTAETANQNKNSLNDSSILLGGMSALLIMRLLVKIAINNSLSHRKKRHFRK